MLFPWDRLAEVLMSMENSSSQNQGIVISSEAQWNLEQQKEIVAMKFWKHLTYDWK